MARWGVVGAGMLGLTLAHHLVRAGHSVDVIESAPSIGGLASVWRIGDVTWDKHYHVTLASDSALRGLLSEIGLTDADFDWVAAQTGFYANGRMFPFSNILNYLRFPILNPLEKARLGATILRASRIRDWRPLEEITAIDWLRKQSGDSVVAKVWLPLLRAKLGTNAESASAAFIWATIARMYAARRAGLEREYFGYVRGGYARILARFEEALRIRGVTFTCGRRVARILRAERGVAVECDDERRTYDRVVVTAAAPIAAKLCVDCTPGERDAMQRVLYQGIVCSSLLVDRQLTPYYITNIADASIPFTAVIEMGSLVDRTAFHGKSLVYLPHYAPTGDPLFEVDDDRLRQTDVSALLRMHPTLREPEIGSYAVSRVRYVAPISTLGYSRRLPPIATSVPGLYCVNSAHIVNGTLNVNETVQLAGRALETITAPASHTRLSQCA